MMLVETRVLSTVDGKLVCGAFSLASAYIWKIQVNKRARFISGGWVGGWVYVPICCYAFAPS